MLTSANRLTKVRDFNLVIKHGRWVNGTTLDVKFLPLAKAGEFFPLPKKETVDNFKKQLKLAVAVGLKISKSAVKRNRAKRQIREALRLLLQNNKIRSGNYILVVAKKSILEKEYAEISQEVELLLKKAGILVS